MLTIEIYTYMQYVFFVYCFSEIIFCKYATEPETVIAVKDCSRC